LNHLTPVLGVNVIIILGTQALMTAGYVLAALVVS
jgi:hypothetical protein